MSNVRLSHSSINKYLECGEKWRLHYHERLREPKVGSALVFGGAIGKTFEAILKDIPKAMESKQSVYDVFNYEWTNHYINDVPVNIYEQSDIVIYSKYDTDTDLIDVDTRGLTSNQIAWLSLKGKGQLMIDSFINNFLPHVEKVYSTEEDIELSNGEGDSSIGRCDTVAQLKGYPKPIILDFKTASRPYDGDSVKKSVQLSQYLHCLSEKYDNTRLCGYVVFLKNITKNRVKVCSNCSFDGSGSRHKTCSNELDGVRCNGEWKEKINPKCEMQMIIDVIPESTEHFIIDNIAAVTDAIKKKVFVKNVNSCHKNQWGRECEFLQKCWKNDESELVKLEEKKQ